MTENEDRQRWESSFGEQIVNQAFNTAAVEAVVRTLAYHIRDRFTPAQLRDLHFVEIGCGTGPNLVWLARKGIKVSGLDISPTALGLARSALSQAGLSDRVGELTEGSAARTPFESESFDGVIEACVFQHLSRAERIAAFREVGRILKPGGVFVGYMLDVGHSLYQSRHDGELPDDPGTLVLEDDVPKYRLENLGGSHFFRREEIVTLLDGFQMVDLCKVTYEIPGEEARKRGFDRYLQSMWNVYARK